MKKKRKEGRGKKQETQKRKMQGGNLRPVMMNFLELAVITNSQHMCHRFATTEITVRDKQLILKE